MWCPDPHGTERGKKEDNKTVLFDTSDPEMNRGFSKQFL